MLLIGCDFSSRPGPRKPIVMALGQAKAGVVSLDALQAIFTLEAFASSLRERRSWVGGFDLPFGLPRELVQTLGWPTQWLDYLRTYQALSRAQIRDLFAAFCNARPAGRKFAHRATDRWAGSSPSMKWVNPPVAYMLHAGVPLLVDAGVSIPGLFAGDSTDVDAHGRPRRVALEAYPGLLAREVLGRDSYKSDDRTKQTAQRAERRAILVDALVQGQTRLGMRLQLTPAQNEALVLDGSGDQLDAVLCLMQAAWGQQQGWPSFGLPVPIDPLEGWIVSALPSAA
ncbi:MAG: DUF429 domain-containing protein [Rhodoferax sp.]|nr:DUF429 domain-containing protein [Rhodoferax sp.]